MKYAKDIHAAFSDLGFIPINGQLKIVNDILEAFLDHDKRNVVLSAPTGIGKSIISAAVSKVFARKFGSNQNCITLMQTNSLVDQYVESFKDDPSFHVMKGAKNYPCAYLEATTIKTDDEVVFTGEDCITRDLDPAMKVKYCMNCDYTLAKNKLNTVETVITNNAYYFISSLFSHHIKPRTLRVFDEAHILNDSFVSHCSILVNEKRLEDAMKHAGKNESLKSSIASLLITLKADKVTEKNYLEYLAKVQTAYSGIGQEQAKNLTGMEDVQGKLKVKRLIKRYTDFNCKIGDFFKYQYKHVFDKVEGQPEFSIKPITIGNMAETILGDFNLFMSATISDSFIFSTMDIERQDTAFIQADPVFSPESKEVILFKHAPSINYKSLTETPTRNFIKMACTDIVNMHNEDKGLILVPSFKLGEEISYWLPAEVKVFCHKSKDKLPELIEKFKKHKGRAVLISPSIFEGLNFSDEDSRFQIIVKAPFASLADKRQKYIVEFMPELYRLNTLMKIVQGIGRSTRHDKDWSVTYMLDKNAVNLFESGLNVWKKEFHIVRS